MPTRRMSMNRDVLAANAGTIGPALCACILSLQIAALATTMDTIGSVRVSCLSPIAVRLEAKTSAGNFEDRQTLMVVNRAWPDVARTKSAAGTTTTITTANYTVTVPNSGSAITGCSVAAGGRAVFTYSALPSGRTTFPAPDELGNGYVIADAPRVVQPAWGSVPMPAGALPTTDPLYATSGWDYRYISTPDVYVFVNTQSNYFNDYLAVRKDFLRLTGPIPIVPLYFLGFASSRWQAVTQAYVIQHADLYRNTYQIPIDVYVVDTDWRSGAYDYNTTYFPNPVQFFTDMHSRGFKVTFNDHPQGSGSDFTTRWNGLTGKMNDGLDFWWFDRNWGGIIGSPVNGIDQEMWGMKMYWDIQKKFLEQKTTKKMRPALMCMRSNDPGNGSVDPIVFPHPGSHRYPGWWTGDQNSDFGMLTKNVAASVADGMRLLPHVQHDIAGFSGCNPGDELYTRWMEFGAYSPQPRVHGTNCGEGSLKRYPWEFSTDTRVIVTRYLAQRYRLMPMMYSALRKCYEDGSPLLQRCDLFWPAATNASAKLNSQYLLGDDILIRPATAEGASMTNGISVSTWIPPGDWFDAWTGQVQTGPKTLAVDSKVWHTPMFIRKGAIITMCPDMLYTSQKPWNPITLEVFPPAIGASVTRSLYEDDKETFNYESGEYAKTDLTAGRSADGMQVTINPAIGNAFAGKLSARGWIVRLHLDAAYTNQVVKVNGTPVTVGTTWTKGASSEARLLNPTAFPTTITSANFPIPLQGEGQVAPPQATGPVVEVWVPSAATSAIQTVALGEYTTGVKPTVMTDNIRGHFRAMNLPGERMQVFFAVPSERGFPAQHVVVALTNLKGETVRTLVDNQYVSRYCSETASLSGLSTGAYFCTLTINGILRNHTRVSFVK